MLTEKEILAYSKKTGEEFYRKNKHGFKGSICNKDDIEQEAMIVGHDFYKNLKKGTINIITEITLKNGTTKIITENGRMNIKKKFLRKKIMWSLTNLLIKCLNETTIETEKEQQSRFVKIDDVEEKYMSVNDEPAPFAFSDIREFCSEKEYKLLYQRFVDKMSLQEIAQEIGSSHQAVAQRLNRTLKMLRLKIKKDFF